SKHTAPRVCRCVRVVLLVPVEETVWSALVSHDFVLHACPRQCLVELGVVLGRDVLVVTGLEREDRRLDLVRALRRPESAVPQAGHPVEPQRPGETVTACP